MTNEAAAAIEILVPAQPGGEWVPLIRIGDVVHFVPGPGHMNAGECIAAVVVRVYQPKDWPGGEDAPGREFIDIHALSTPPPHRSALITTPNGPSGSTPLVTWAQFIPVANADDVVGRWHMVH